MLGFAVLFVDPIGIPKVDGMLIQNFLRGLGFPDLFKLLAVNKEWVFEMSWHLQNGGLTVNPADDVLEVIVISNQVFLKRAQSGFPLLLSNVGDFGKGTILESELILFKLQDLEHVVDIKNHIGFICLSRLKGVVAEI